MSPRPKSVSERFADRYMPEPMSGCWLWLTSLRRGYGQIKDAGRTLQAHRVSWEMHRGRIPAGLDVLHKCDVRSCVNPDHLFLGTHIDNMADMAAKGRAASGNNNGSRLYPERLPRGDAHHFRRDPSKQPRGSRHGLAKLDEKAVADIRASPLTNRDLARKYGVTPQTIYYVRVEGGWAHVS